MKYFFMLFFYVLFVPPLNAQPQNDDASFNMGEMEGTSLCEGTLFDSGGETGDYQVDENIFFTICPTVFNQCITINVAEYDTERNFDFLTIYEGENTNEQILATINGTGRQTLLLANSDCITVQFTSDGSQNASGFRLSWQCSVEECPAFEAITCDAPDIIDQIPFQSNDLTTCFAGNNIEIGPCGTDDFLSGQEYIFAYDSPGGECIAVNITGIIPESGISIIQGCPERGDGICIEQREVTNGLDHIFLPNVALKEKGIYYFLIANEDNCTPFNIEITPSDACPNTFPSAANCEDALILNGCSPTLPVALTVERGAGDPDFFKFDVNNGCWEGVFATNYTWFTLEAQGDGAFAFLLDNNNPNESVDIDFNIWGPFDNKADACIAAENSQPIRSSWADASLYSVTGLANINPVLGNPITSTCEGAFGEGFVQPIQVKKGEVYVVLINDFDGVIFSGAISIDFSGSDAAVLSNIDENISIIQDTFICEGNSIELTARNASAYDWSPSESLSCRTCSNPIATPTETTTYTLNAQTVCNTITEEITIEVIKVDAGIDQTVCQGAMVQINADANGRQISYQWTSPDGEGNLSCIDCPNPIIQANTAGVFEYIVEVETANCMTRDTLVILVDSLPTDRTITPNDTTVCRGSQLVLSSPIYTPQFYPNIQHQWVGDIEFISSDSIYNVVVSPTDSIVLQRIDKNGACIDTVSSIINVLPFIEVPITAQNSLICEGESIELLAGLPEDAENISWTPLENISCTDCPNPAISPNQTTLYTLSGTSNNCPLMGSLEVEVIDFSNTQIINYKSSTIIIGQSVDSIFLESNLPSIASIEWFENGQLIEGATDRLLNYIPLANEPISTEDRTVLIEAKITTSEGCTYTSEISILVKPPLVPNIFSPNNDQKNDFFNILLANKTDNIATFKVYNRWGRLVYDNDAPETGWNGGMRNKLDDLMPAAVYIYVIQYRVDQQIASIRGNVTLVR